eukprot:6176280-Pleurochrysis_carterae.AAC.2
MRAPCTVLFFALLESFSLTAKAASRSSLLVQAATNATYNSSLALAYSRLSSAAYCDAPDLAAWDCLPCSQHVVCAPCLMAERAQLDGSTGAPPSIICAWHASESSQRTLRTPSPFNRPGAWTLMAIQARPHGDATKT